MFEILAVTSPFFLLVLAGFIAARGGLLPLSAIPGLNAFVLYFGLPCMLFRFGANTPIEQLIDLPLAGLYLLCSLTLTLSLNLGLLISQCSLHLLLSAKLLNAKLRCKIFPANRKSHSLIG